MVYEVEAQLVSLSGVQFVMMQNPSGTVTRPLLKQIFRFSSYAVSLDYCIFKQVLE